MESEEDLTEVFCAGATKATLVDSLTTPIEAAPENTGAYFTSISVRGFRK